MQTNIPAAITLRRADRTFVRFEKDGYISELGFGERIRLIVLPNNRQATCITVDKEKYISEADVEQIAIGPLFSRWIEVPAPYETNHLRLVGVTSEGQLTVWEIAIVRQGRDNFFLTTQLVYDEQCYLADDGYAVVPKFSQGFADKPWPEFVTLVNDLAPNRLDFPGLQKYTPAPAPSILLGPDEARVEWFSQARRLGIAITPLGSHAIIMAKDVPQNGTRLRYLQAGDTVRFERMVPQATGCPYRLEALTLVA